ncbi:ribonuclease P protein component [Candidatus Methylomirabilis sp.]|uniref:ribonuclease P protein component n=1 Tax=Candidatus Methylomirabilis sp. TaxID=2032687 RepID=UPI002A68CA33|nr:ribonuclease P protein component [Candidatus Methylomirabilis sp.]
MRQPESGRAARPRRALNTNYFTLYARFPSTKKQELRLAFGTRAGTATVRNKAKRLARETFRLNRHQLPQGIEIVITAKKGIGALSRRDMRGQIFDLFERARRLSPSSSSEAGRPDDISEHR